MAFENIDININMTLPRNTADRSDRSINETDHLVPHANRLLVGAGKAAWWMVKVLGGVVIRIPGWFVRSNKHLSDKRRASGPDVSRR